MNEKGFTLIEILIAVGILVGMSLFLYGTMGRALEGREKIERRNMIYQSVRVGLGKMVDDLTQAFVANKVLEGVGSKYLSGMKGTENELNFSSFSHYHYMEDAKDADQVTVGYFLKKNSRGGFDLYRRESQRLSDRLDEGGDSYILIEDVKDFALSYYDSNKKEWESIWDTSSVSSLGRLPQAVKVSITALEFVDEDDEEPLGEYPFQTMARIELFKSEIKF